MKTTDNSGANAGGRTGLAGSAARWALAVAAALAVSPVRAEPGDRDLTELSLDELLETKVQTVTAAARRSQSVSDAPSAVSVITSDDIRKLGY